MRLIHAEIRANNTGIDCAAVGIEISKQNSKIVGTLKSLESRKYKIQTQQQKEFEMSLSLVRVLLPDCLRLAERGRWLCCVV